MAEKKYRVWYIINPPDDSHYHYVDSPEEGYKFTNEESQRQLTQSWITENAFGFQEFIDGEWQEWEDESGDELDEHFQAIEAANEFQGKHI